MRFSVGLVMGGALVVAGFGARAATPEPADGLPEHPNDLIVIANRTVQTKGMTPAVLRQIFLRRRRSLAASRLLPVNAKPATWERTTFRRRVLRMTRDEEARYWQDQRIQAGVNPPAEFRRILKAVYKLKGALGYVRRANYRPGVVKVVLVLPAKAKESPSP